MIEGGPGPEEIARQAAQAETGPREPSLAQRVERYYPIPGEYLLREIRETKWEELPQLIDNFLARKEGLFLGPDNWNLGDPHQLLFLYNLFTTVEGAMDRPSLNYPEQEIELRLESRAFELQRKARTGKGELTREEKDREEKDIGLVMRMENIMKARAEFDMAFIQRMDTCEVAEIASELLGKDSHYRKSVKPDRGVWESLFSGEFGESVDRVLRRIVVAGAPTGELAKLRANRREVFTGEFQPVGGLEPDVYVGEIGKTEVFKKWLTDLLQTANGRMDVVWTAWRLALVWEIPAELGSTVRKGEYKIADPPIGNDFFTWAMHINEKRALEYGWKKDFQRTRSSKYLTHSGYPLSIGRIPKILGSYLHESEIDEIDAQGKKTGKKISLWELWWEKGKKLSQIPWFETDIDPSAGMDEFPPASYGGWLLQRTRAWPVIKDLRSRPSIKEIGDPDFFGQRVRNWDKIFRPSGNNVKPEDNPRTWWVGGILLAHHRVGSKDIPLVKEMGEDVVIRTYLPDEVWGTSRKGEGERRPPSISEILDHAEQSGFLRRGDIDWLKNKLKIQVAIL